MGVFNPFSTMTTAHAVSEINVLAALVLYCEVFGVS